MRNHSHKTDEELFIMIKAGDSGAFTTLYNRYAERLFAIAYHFSGQKCMAEDMVQEVFTSLWDRRCSIEIVSVSAYLATAARFSVFACLQKESRRKKILEKIPSANTAYSGESAVNAIFLKEKRSGQNLAVPVVHGRQCGCWQPLINMVLTRSTETL